MESSRAGVLAELLIEGCNTPALAPPSVACTRKSGSFDACTMSTLLCAQIEPGRTCGSLSEVQGRLVIRAHTYPLEYTGRCRTDRKRALKIFGSIPWTRGNRKATS